MLSATMLLIIFLEISIAVVTVLGGILVASQYLKTKNRPELYVALVLAGGAATDLGMLASQIAFTLQNNYAYIGFKVFLVSILFTTIFVWFHLAHIYGFSSRFITGFLLSIALIASYLTAISKVGFALQEGVIVPSGTGINFVIGFMIIASIVALESIFAVLGLHKMGGSTAARYRISKAAGVLFLIFIFCLIAFLITQLIPVYVCMWLFAFFAMVFLFLFSMVPEGSPLVANPFNFFRTRILFKLVITLIIMIILSLEGMGVISIGLTRRALSESVIESYKRVAEDTILLINRSAIDSRSEQSVLRSIAGILEKTRIGDRGAIFLISPSKNVYINREKKWISLGTLQPSAANKLLFGKTGGGEIDIFGEKVVAAYIPIKNLGWRIIVGQPIDYAYSRIEMMEGTFIIFILTWIVFTVVIGMVFARNIEGPIKAMKKGIIKIAAGDLDYKINIDKIDEIGELANTFNTMTTELKQSQESLIRSERLSSLGYMAAGMAHEIKNALVPLRTLTDLMAVSGKDEAFIAKFNELVPREIERINRLSTDLLHYSRPAEPVFEYMDLNNVIEETAKFLEVQARKKGVAIKLKLSRISEVKVDREKMLGVLANLVLNAIEAMEGGEILLSSYEKEEKVIVEIADNGPGIPEENMKKVFVPFFTTKREGTGMGLAIVQRVVADHGGTIDFKSAHGFGTKFFLSFPKKA